MFQPHVVPEVPNEDSPAETSGLVRSHKYLDCRALAPGNSYNRSEPICGCERLGNDLCPLSLFLASPEPGSMGFRDGIPLSAKRVGREGEPRIVPCLSSLLLPTVLATVSKPCAQRRRRAVQGIAGNQEQRIVCCSALHFILSGTPSVILAALWIPFPFNLLCAQGLRDFACKCEGPAICAKFLVTNGNRLTVSSLTTLPSAEVSS